MTEPALTIGMPVYNGERYIEQAIDSLLAQTFTDLELLIADNASTDRTPEICGAYARRDPRVRYVRHERNLGVFPNTEFVMRRARGTYFMLVGDDDIYHPEYAARLMALHAANPGLILAYADFGYVTGDGKKTAGGTTVFLDPASTPVRNLALHIWKRPVLPMIMGIFRTDVLAAGLPFVSFGSMTGGVDLVFMVRVLAAGRVASARDVLFWYRLKDRSATVPSTWPTGAFARRWEVWKLNVRVAAGMSRAIGESPLGPSAKLALSALSFVSLAAHLLALPILVLIRRVRAASPMAADAL